MYNIKTPQNPILIYFSYIQTTLNVFTYIYNDLFKVCLSRVEQKTSRSFFFSLYIIVFSLRLSIRTRNKQPLKSKAEVTWEEWSSGLKHCDGKWKVLVPYCMLSWV